ncbi:MULTISPECIES: hypothetical protein [unclassified Sinorhizobium]|uniref:hypothetical protein n=1 Tax=unclassified Sinorhizobium TaxID=2613772 RepID=UPI0024C3285C|nr:MULTISPECIES: hypothetical protein [unclassified Sinorhizobium]MDK1373439.1 hypothetical protein [Sinorhizobium sp. 6-70]MDK1481274.1 hypothetical protein [Sinorhizobium sp. 6-117]
MNEEIGRLADSQRPAPPERVAECLDALKRGGMAAPAAIAPTDFLREYTLALSNVPACGLMAAIVKLKRGEYATAKPAFMPLPAELAAFARKEALGAREDMARARATAETLQALSRPKPSPESKARVRAILARFRGQVSADRAEPPLPEQGQ